MNDQEIEQEVQAKGLEAPRITPSRIDELMSRLVYTFDVRPNGSTTTLAHAFLDGSFYLATGVSACVSPENFDEKIGMDIAMDNARSAARDRLWELEGYMLYSHLRCEARLQLPVSEERRDHIEEIARVCHEVNRAYCQALGDHSQPVWEDAPEWQRVSARMGVDLHLSGDFGPEASHVSWMQQKLDEGWKYGPVKDPEAKQHPCIVPFAELPREQQAKDFIFRAVVHALALV